jgi:hypothetical protein
MYIVRVVHSQGCAFIGRAIEMNAQENKIKEIWR